MQTDFEEKSVAVAESELRSELPPHRRRSPAAARWILDELAMPQGEPPVI